MNLERRYLQAAGASVRLSQRATSRTLTGYAAVFYQPGSAGTEYPLFDGAVERIRPGAFDRALSEQHDCRCLFNHDANNLLARSGNSTLRLSVDSKGLRYEIDIDETDPDHQRVASKVQRGDLAGSSFAFRATSVNWEETASGDVRWIDDLILYDVGPVTYPAYGATSTGLRSDDQVAELKREHEIWRQADNAWRERWLKLQKLKAEAPAFDGRAAWLAAQKKMVSNYN
jgi:HK97 family phage prohead protease